MIGIFEAQYERGEPLTVVEPGTQTRDFTHIDDIIDGIMLCAARGSGDGYLLGFGQERPIVEVAALFGVEYGWCPTPPRRARTRPGGHHEGARARLGAEARPWTTTSPIRRRPPAPLTPPLPPLRALRSLRSER